MFQAKLHMPCVGSGIVQRKKIEEKLSLLPEHRFAYISAPAGYGKTTAVVDYLIRENRKHAWFSIDESDNDPVRFWRYLTSAIARCCGNSDFETISIDAKLVASNISVDLLISMLEQVPEEFIIVLDDYHLIENSTIQSSVEHLVRLLPTNIKLIFLSRKEPESYLSVLCSRGAAIRLGANEIAFAPEETAEFFSRKGLCLTDEELSIMDTFTEGWVAGLVAASFSIQKSGDRAQTIRGFSGRNNDVSTILEYEVFCRWTEKIQSFLIHTAFLDRLSGPLCTAVTGHESSTVLLKLLAESNSFIIPMDTENSCYRYHHLFQRFLLDRFEQESEEVRRPYYRRAGEWYLAHGQTADGIHWLIESRDYERALPLVMERWFDMTRDNEFLLWKQWIDAIPETFYENSNTTFTAYSWILSMENEVEQAEVWTEKARACFERNKARLEKEEHDYLEAHVLFAEANTAFYRLDAARVLDRMRFLSTMKLNTPVVIGEMNWGEPNMLKTAYGFRGRLSLVEQCMPALDVLDGLLGSYAAYFAVVAAEFLYERNALNELDGILTEHMKTIIGIGFPGVIVPCFLVQAKGRLAKGDPAGALSAVAEAKRLLGDKPGSVWQYHLDIFAAELHLRAGDTDKALALLDVGRLSVYDPLSASREAEYTVFARFLMQEKQLQDALILLKRLEDFARQENRLYSRMELLCLVALCHARTGDYTKGAKVLEEALFIGSAEGYVRTFVDEGAPMAELLSHYQVMSRSDEELQHELYAKKLFRMTNEYLHTVQSAEEQGTVLSGAFTASLLSTRELQILRLLAESKENAAIAEELRLSLSSVKQHNSHIFDKLGVKNRNEAVTRARALELLQ
ncbi:LuxR C-terminal-related transcriptional regulator [Oscillibacter sp.]|uniref:LuxR C-terminal-related transcriptional regulator n=1 Tax=Oscillibacter sp. TaxID=1945593 RepID=UPI0033912122